MFVINCGLYLLTCVMIMISSHQVIQCLFGIWGCAYLIENIVNCLGMIQRDGTRQGARQQLEGLVFCCLQGNAGRAELS